MPPPESRLDFDARIEPLPLDGEPLGGQNGPGRHRLSANRYFLTLDGEPLPVVAGEVLPQRYPATEWEDAVRALRDAGCTMVSSYVFWGLVEPEPGRFDFSGSNDIRRFAQICAEYGLAFSPRIGPFNNSEYLVGGLPPWLFGKPVVERSDDPAYLALVRRYFSAVAGQLEGLYFSDGGPILVVQLENELSHAPNDWGTLFGYTATEHRGPVGPAFTEHMSTLRGLALDVGIDPPFFSMTGWRTAGDVPAGAFLPSYSAYMDLHPRPGPNLRLTTFFQGDYPYRGKYPVAFCEMGTGSPHRAAYRSRTPADATVTTAITRMGSVESIYLGYYLFHGGTNPIRGDGFGWTPKEPTFSQRSYDFWAPVSEFGERRESYYALTPLNHLVREFGKDLAALPVVEPADPVIDPDEDRLRSVMRGSGSRGFVFLSNYGNNQPMSDRESVRIGVRGDQGELDFPRRLRLVMRSGKNLVLPAGLDLGAGIRLTGTAQPLARLGDAADPAVVFAAQQHEAEYLVSGVAVADVSAPPAARVRQEVDGVLVVLPAGGEEPLEVRGPSGPVRIVTLTWDEAEHSQVFGQGSGKTLATCADDFTVDGRRVTISRRVPVGATGRASASVRVVTARSTTRLPVMLPEPEIRADAIQVEAITPSRAVLRMDEGCPASAVGSLWADIDYTGDLCRMFDVATGLLEGDNFHHGLPWRVKLGRFRRALRGEGLQIRVEPVARKEPVDDPDGILLDSAIRVQSEAHIDALNFSQEVTAEIHLPVE